MNEKLWLTFTYGNTKLKGGEIIFDLPAGHSCPFAQKCFARAHRVTAKIIDGPLQEFRCYAASQENYLPSVRALRWRNFDTLRTKKTRSEFYRLIQQYLPYGLLYRVHSSGDFFTQAYFDAWMDIARRYPERTFYAYTKALPFWVKRLKTIPHNFHLNASYGGKFDNLIVPYNLKSVKVVTSELEAKNKGLKIDHDDSHAWKFDKDFALLIHGNGRPGTLQAKLHYHKSKATIRNKAKVHA
jgi:hypothetical protein